MKIGDDMTEAEVIDVFREAGAILEGHFILTSGLRSPVFLQKARVFMYPDKTERLCRALAAKVRAAGLGRIDLIVSPAVGGIVPGYETAPPARRAGGLGRARGGCLPAAPLRDARRRQGLDRRGHRHNRAVEP